MEYDRERETWVLRARPTTLKGWYELDKGFYDSVVWSLVAFMVGLVASVALIAGGVI